jgi:hypothetical protein
MSKFLFTAVILAAVMVGAASPTLAQTDYGKITVILSPLQPGWEIILVSDQRELKCTPRDQETCVFSALEPGNYEIQFGPTRIPVTTVSLLSGQSRTVERDVSTLLAAGVTKSDAARAEGVQAPALVPLIERIIPGRRGERVTSQELQQLPNRNQSEEPLFELQPGVVSTGVSDFAGFIFNGQPGTQNVERENGLSSNPIVRSSASFQDPNALFADIADRQSTKAYESFAIDTSNTPAYFGTGTGTQLVKTVKKGKKKFGGEVYEFLANDILSARDFFDFDRQPSLRFNLFGFNLTGSFNDRLYAFFNYEGIRASAGNTLFAAAPKLSLATHADAAVAGLIRSFRANGASIVDDASADSNFDIIQLEAKNHAELNSVSTRFDYEPSDTDKFTWMYRGSRARTNIPDGASGRRSISLDSSHKGVFNYERALTKDSTGSTKLNNQFIFGVIKTPTRLFARCEDNISPELFNSAISIDGEINQTGIAGQPSALAISTSGGLLGGDFAGRYLSLNTWQFSFIDQMQWTRARDKFTFGGEVRLLRTSVDQLFGTTYKFGLLVDFLANRTAVEHSGDLGSLTGSPGARRVSQTYYIGYLQHEFRFRENAFLTSGVRYEYYTPLRELNQSVVNVDPATGDLVPASEDLYKTRKTNFLPRIAIAWAPNWNTQHKPNADLKYASTVISASFGMHVGPDVFDNILRPVINNRLNVAGENLSFPIDPRGLVASSNANDRQFKPLALSRDYSSPNRVYKFDIAVKRDLIARNPNDADDEDLLQDVFVTFAYVGNRSRALLLRNFANRIVSVQTNPDPSGDAIVRREFDIESGGEPLHPYGEFEFLTTGGRSSYDSFQASLNGRLMPHFPLFQVSYTLARDRGNTEGDGAIAAGNPLSYDYDFGYNLGDVRHKFDFATVMFLPCLIPNSCRSSVGNQLLTGWSLAAKGVFQSGAPIDVRIKRPDVVYVDQAGNVFSKPAVGRTAVLNTPGGGSSVAAFRPNLVAGANPYLHNDRSYLNPAAFSIPAPGELGNLPRGALRGPGVRFVDLSVRKEIALDPETKKRILSFNVDVTNIFNFTNFKLTKDSLPDKLGTEISENQLQPNQPFTPEAAPAFGVFTRTFKRKPDLGSSRQIQFGLSLKF